MAKSDTKGVKAAKKALSPRQQAAQRVRNNAAAKKVAETRRTTAKKNADLAVTDVGEWKKASKDRAAETKLPVPSGHVCLVKVIGLEPFFKQGLIPNNLLPIVSAALNEGKGLSKKEVQDIETDPEMIAAMLELTDSVVCEVVLQPEVTPVSVREEIMADETLSAEEKQDKIDALLFVDEVDLMDKMFIFQYVVGGTRDLERFRDESQAALEDVADVEAVSEEAE